MILILKVMVPLPSMFIHLIYVLYLLFNIHPPDSNIYQHRSIPITSPEFGYPSPMINDCPDAISKTEDSHIISETRVTQRKPCSCFFTKVYCAATSTPPNNMDSQIGKQLDGEYASRT